MSSDDPIEKAKASLSEVLRNARSAALDIKKDLEKTDLTKSLDDAGREIVRAATSVASHLGAELEVLGRELRERADGVGGDVARGSRPPPASDATDGGTATGGGAPATKSDDAKSDDGDDEPPRIRIG